MNSCQNWALSLKQILSAYFHHSTVLDFDFPQNQPNIGFLNNLQQMLAANQQNSGRQNQVGLVTLYKVGTIFKSNNFSEIKTFKCFIFLD